MIWFPNFAFPFRNASYCLTTLPDGRVSYSQRIWETSQLLRHFKSFAAKAKDDDKSLKIKVKCWFSPSSMLFPPPRWMNLLCFWGQKGNIIVLSVHKLMMTSQLHVQDCMTLKMNSVYPRLALCQTHLHGYWFPDLILLSVSQNIEILCCREEGFMISSVKALGFLPGNPWTIFFFFCPCFASALLLEHTLIHLNQIFMPF